MRDESPLGRMQVLGAALLFSTGALAIKWTTLDAAHVAGLRSLIAAITLFALVRAGRRFWQPLSILVGLGYAATLLLFVIANKLTTAISVIALQSTAPLYLLALAPWVLGEPLRRDDLRMAAPIAVGLLLILIATPPAAATAPDPRLGNWLAAGSGLTWALALTGLRAIARDSELDPTAPVIAGNLLAFAACAPFLSWAALPRLAGTDWLTLAWLGIVQIGIAYVLLARGLRRLRAFETALLLLVEPVLNPLWVWLVLGENPHAWALAGAALIIGTSAWRTLRAPAAVQ
jgi:drug/metabolite transporter (DMT)-like permease